MSKSELKENTSSDKNKDTAGFREKALVQWITHQVLFEDNPNVAEVVQNFEVLAPFIPQLLNFSRLQAIEELKQMDYPENLAKETAVNVVGKVVSFFALFLARQNIKHWLPDDLMKMSTEERAQASPALLDSLDSAIQLAKAAYYWDEQLDRPDPVDSLQAVGLHGYEYTAFPPLIQSVESTLSGLSSDTKEDVCVAEDIAKLKLLRVVDIYTTEFLASWKKLQEDNYFQTYLRSEGLLALLPVVKHMTLLSTAYRTSGGQISEEGVEILKQAVLPLADVFSFELVNKVAHDAIQNGKSNMKIPLPTDFKESLSLEYGKSEYTFYDAFPALVISAAKGQGLMMVANTQYLLRRYDRYYDKHAGEYKLKLKSNRNFKEVKELLNPTRNEKLNWYINALQLLVRISDDIGDFESDKGKAGNVLIASTEDQSRVSEILKPIDQQSGTSLDQLMKDLYAGISKTGGISLPEGTEDEDVASYWIKRLEAEVDKAEQTLFALNGQEEDKDMQHRDYKDYVFDIRAITLGAIRIGTLANDVVFTKVMKLASAA